MELTSQRTIHFGRPWITDDDRAAVMEVLHRPILTHGPAGTAFEDGFSSFIGPGCHSVSFSSCMGALHMAYFGLGLQPGDEVIVPAQTHVATVHAVELAGARPVFVDCELRTGNMDLSRLEASITPRTRALSIVHFLGIPCAMDTVMAIARRHGLHVVEDCALAIGSRYQGRHVGLWGDAGCFSFYPVKHITTGEGGMYITRHADQARRIAQLRAFGIDRSHGERTLPGQYDVVALGLNYRMSEMQAALGCVQLTRLGTILERRKANFERLKHALAGIAGLTVLDAATPEAENSHYCLSLVLPEALRPHRNAVLMRLKAAGVGTSVYYPHPVQRLTYYRERYGYTPGAYPNAEAISDGSIALPVGPHLDAGDMDYVAHQVIHVLGTTA